MKKYMREYRQRPDVKAKQREYYQRHADELRAKRRIGNPDRIKAICLEHGFSPDVANAIAMDGIILDKKMKERGII